MSDESGEALRPREKKWTHVRLRVATLERLKAVMAGILADPLVDRHFGGERNPDPINPAAGEISIDALVNHLLDQREKKTMRKVMAKRRKKGGGGKRPRSAPLPD